jgi:hypothetical protein
MRQNIRDVTDFGFTARVQATVLAANVYAKSEENTFGFSKSDIDGYLWTEREMMRCETFGKLYQLTAHRCRGLLHCCISDTSKQLFLHHSGFIPHLLDGLMLADTHPRHTDAAGHDTPMSIKTAVQRDFAECIQQVSLFPPGCEALKADPAVIAGLEVLVERAWSEEAKDCARGALMQLTDRMAQKHLADALSSSSSSAAAAGAGGSTVEPPHVMMSYNWAVQAIVMRIVAELQRRGYLVWVDLERMKGSVMDAMSEAVEGAEIFLFCVSELYKESANCRLEATYAQQVLHTDQMIPLMMSQGFRPKGWLGLILGSSMYYAFYPAATGTDTKFLRQIDNLTKEIGDRGKAPIASVSEGVPPTGDIGGTRAATTSSAGSSLPKLEPEPEPAAALPLLVSPQHHAAPAAATPAPTAHRSSTTRSVSGTGRFTPSVQQSPASAASVHSADHCLTALSTPSALLAPDGHHFGSSRGGGKSSSATSTLAVAPAAGSFEAVAALLEAQQDKFVELLREERAEAKAERLAIEAKMNAQMERLRRDNEQQLREKDLLVLQARLSALRVSDLLTEAELERIEDAIADDASASASASATTSAARALHSEEEVVEEEEQEEEEKGCEIQQMVRLSVQFMHSDRAFARQLRRRFIE